MGRFLTNSIITVNRQILSGVLYFITSILIARGLGVQGQGIYALVILLPMMLFRFFNFGVQVSSVYYINNLKMNLQDAYKSNLVWGYILSLVSLVLGLIVIFFFSRFFFREVPNYLLICSLFIVPFMFFTKYLLAIFQSQEDFNNFNLIGLVQHVLNFVFFCKW